MRRLLLACGCLAALAATAARAAPSAGATPAKRAPPARSAPEARRLPSLTAAQIVERNVRARGGLQAWEAVRTLRMSGELDAGGKSDPQLPFTLALKRPHKSRLELAFAGKTAVQVYDGAQGWKLRPYLNREEAEPFRPEELASARSAAELDGPLVDYQAKGTRVELAGTEKVEGRDTYKLKLTLAGGKEQLVWVDGTTFLEAKIGGDPRKLDGRPHKVEIYCRDYRSVRGLKLPFVLETAVEGVKERHRMAIRDVAVNPPLEDALFQRPAVVLARASGAGRAP